MGRSLALWAYLSLTARAAAAGRRRLARRLAEGKEDPARLDERQGLAGRPRPDGPLVWFHAASVGESLSLLEVIRRLTDADPALNVLVTTGTVTSSELLVQRLPPRAVHQFIPLDIAPFVRRFLDHWRPDLAVWTESELWPTLIVQTHARDIPLLLLNARMSDRSAQRWRRFLPGAARSLLRRFHAVQAQDRATGQALMRLGLPRDRLEVTGTLKEGMPPLDCDESDRARFTKMLCGRPVWAAASTHPGEDEIVAEAHAAAARGVLRLLCILVPRHPDRGDAIAAMLRARGLTVAQRSRGEEPGPNTAIFLADTMGELGLWYRLAPLSFVGGSLVPIGGHNPFEPAALGSAILHGPHVTNFADVYDRLGAAGGARLVTSAATLAAAVSDLSQPDRRAPMAFAAWEFGSAGAEVTDKAIALIRDTLATAQTGSR
jgi:3-deoxy-D-manno-octulosonic-acid transferase